MTGNTSSTHGWLNSIHVHLPGPVNSLLDPPGLELLLHHLFFFADSFNLLVLNSCPIDLEVLSIGDVEFGSCLISQAGVGTSCVYVIIFVSGLLTDSNTLF